MGLLEQVLENGRILRKGSNGTGCGGANFYAVNCDTHKKWSVQRLQYVRTFATPLLMGVVRASILSVMFLPRHSAALMS